MTLSADKAQRERDTSKFIYLLNAMENAGQSDHPYKNGYAPKRAAVLKYVADLEAAFEAGRRDAREELTAAHTLIVALLEHRKSGSKASSERVWQLVQKYDLIRSVPAPPEAGDKRGAGEDGQ